MPSERAGSYLSPARLNVAVAVESKFLLRAHFVRLRPELGWQAVLVMSPEILAHTTNEATGTWLGGP